MVGVAMAEFNRISESDDGLEAKTKGIVPSRSPQRVSLLKNVVAKVVGEYGCEVEVVRKMSSDWP